MGHMHNHPGKGKHIENWGENGSNVVKSEKYHGKQTIIDKNQTMLNGDKRLKF